MKSSQYNFFLSEEDKLLCFNSLSLKYFRLPKNKEEMLKKIIEDPTVYLSKSSSFFQTLYNGNFIVEKSANELEIIKERYRDHVYSKHYKLVLLPTLECNFRCWYCVQRHVKGSMDNDIMNRIYKHLEYMIVQEKIEALTIEWFGGEPFKYYREVIQPISIFANEICQKYNIPFKSQATTNGYLISSEIAAELSQFKFTTFHITLDGNREYHNKTRVSKNSSSFDTILHNINNICTQMEDVKIALRVNYDDKNLDPDRIIDEIDEIISPENKKNIEFLFRKVWQVPHFKNETEMLKTASSLIKKKQFNEEIGFNVYNIPCYASKKYYNTISFNGNVYKCTAKNSMHSDSLGYLNDDGTIKWHHKDFDNVYYTALFENEECIGCKHLPICMGPCPQKFEENNLIRPAFKCPKRMNMDKLEAPILTYCTES